MKIVLAGDIVKLRNPLPEDFVLFYRLASDPDIRYMSSDLPFVKPDEDEFTDRYLRYIMPSARDYLPFVIIDAETNIPVGQIHAGQIDYHNLNCMIGFEVLKSFHRRGYGSDAVETFLDYLFYDVGLNRVGVGIYDYNKASREMVESLGFILEGRLTKWIRRGNEFHDKLLYGIMADEWTDSETE